MLAHVRDRSRTLRTAFAAVAVAGAAAAWSSVALGQTKTGIALSAVLTIGPALLYAAIAAPIAFPFGLYAAITPGDEILTLPAEFGTVTRLIGAAAAFAMLFYMLRNRRFLDPPRVVGTWLLLFLWMGASLLWAIDVPTAWDVLFTSLQLLGFYIIASMFPVSLRGLKTLLYMVILGGLAAACYGIYLFANGVSIQNRLALSDVNAAGDPNHFAASLILPIGLSLYFMLWSRSLAVRIAMVPCVLVLVMAVGLTGSRGSVLGLAAVVAFLLVRDRHRFKLGLYAAALAIPALAVAGPNLIQRFSSAGLDGGAGRSEIWHVGLLAFTQNWLFGAGYENFAFAYDRAYIHVFQPIYAGFHRAPHNLLLGTGVELGVIGLALMLLAWLGQFKLLNFINSNDPRYGLRIALQACLVGMFVIAMFSDIMVRKYIWLLFMVIVLTRNVQIEKKKHA